MTASGSIADRKAAVRRSVRARRTRTAQDRPLADAAIRHRLLTLIDALDGSPTHPRTPLSSGAAGVRASLRLAAFNPMSTGPAEPGGPGLLEALRTHLDRTRPGSIVYGPRVTGSSLEWVACTGDYATSSWGIEEPTGPAHPDLAALDLDLLIVPALACDSEGWRLGQGGGFYDRTLTPQARPPRVWTLLDDADILPTVPRDAHDMRVDRIITPRRMIDFPSKKNHSFLR